MQPGGFMKGLNRVILVGHLGATPELQKSKNGVLYSRVSLATHRQRKIDEGKYESVTEWHRIMIWGKLAENCAAHCTKGTAIAVDGHLESYRIEKEGGFVTQTSIVAEEVQFFINPKQRELALQSTEANLFDESASLSA
jgi:single-strand DNA-binding protein